MTRQKIQVLDLPRVRAAWARVTSKDSKAPRAVRYIRGKATTAEAKMAEYHTMVSRRSKTSRNHRPMVRLGPSSRSRK